MEGNRATTVQAVGAVVNGKLVAFTVECELTFCDAVAITTDKGSEVATFGTELLVVGNVVVTEADIRHVAVLVRHHDADDASTEVGEAHLHAVLVGNDIETRRVAGKVSGVKTRECKAVGTLSITCGFASARSQAESCNDCSKTKENTFLHTFLIKI